MWMEGYRRRLGASPVERHENPKLERSRVGNLRTLRALRHVVRILNPQLVFLIKTKSNQETKSKMKILLNFQGAFNVPSKGLSGGLMLLWDEDLKILISSFSDGHIDAIVKEEVGWWRFSSFYGNPIVAKWSDSWKLIERLQDSSDLPWILGGDFNKILIADEKKGGAGKFQKQMEAFKEIIDKCNLKDMGFFGENTLGKGRWVRKV